MVDRGARATAAMAAEGREGDLLDLATDLLDELEDLAADEAAAPAGQSMAAE